jgi:hypothetical protein
MIPGSSSLPLRMGAVSYGVQVVVLRSQGVLICVLGKRKHSNGFKHATLIQSLPLFTR